MTTKETAKGFPKVSEATANSTLKDDCFDLPEPGSSYDRQLDKLGEEVMAKIDARLRAQGKMPPETPEK